MEWFLAEQAQFSRDLSKAMRLTLQAWPSKVANNLEFQKFFTYIKSRSLNVTGWQNRDDSLPKATQQIYPNFDQDLWNIWGYFSEKWSTDRAKAVAETLFDRRIIGYEDALKCRVVLNYAWKYIFRDTNLSISLLDEQNREIGLIWFFILPDGAVEIFQLQCKKKYGANGEHFQVLIDQAKKFLGELWFERLRIVNSKTLFITKTPTVLPSKIWNQAEMEEWMQKHWLHMRLTYDVNPVRKWWFHRIKDQKLAENYSGEMDL